MTDESGRPAGLVHAVRLRTGPGAEQVLGPVVGLVVAGARWRPRLSHAWGYAEGRTRGPAVLTALLGPEASRARVVPVSAVLAWQPHVVVAGPLERYSLLSEQVST